MQAEQVTESHTSSSRAIQVSDDTIGVEATTSDEKSTTTAAATAASTIDISPSNGSIEVNVAETDIHSNDGSNIDKNICNSSSSNDKGIAITTVGVDTTAASERSSCISSATKSAVVITTTATTAAAAPKARGFTTSNILNNNSSSSTVLPRTRLVVDTRKQAVTSNTNTVKVSLLR
jgi:hypothetical protein